jgi:hypothetical protein
VKGFYSLIGPLFNFVEGLWVVVGGKCSIYGSGVVQFILRSVRCVVHDQRRSEISKRRIFCCKKG